jgi:hypothetical protein
MQALDAANLPQVLWCSKATRKERYVFGCACMEYGVHWGVFGSEDTGSCGLHGTDRNNVDLGSEKRVIKKRVVKKAARGTRPCRGICEVCFGRGAQEGAMDRNSGQRTAASREGTVGSGWVHAYRVCLSLSSHSHTGTRLGAFSGGASAISATLPLSYLVYLA